MKIFTAASLALILSTSIAPACEIQRVNTNFGYMRSKPAINSAPLWKLGNEVAVVWCGRTFLDNRGVIWNWVATAWNEEQWPHKGWISSRIVERDVPTITHDDTPAETFEEGGE